MMEWQAAPPSPSTTPRIPVNTSLAAIASAIVFACAPGFVQAAAPVASADPAVVQATRDMLAAMKIRDSMRASVAAMEQQMPAQMRAGAVAGINDNPGLTPEQKADALRKLDAGIAASAAEMHVVFSDPTLVDDMLAEMVPLYAETYTLDEIRQMTAFYTSPVGQKMLANMPALMSRSFEISQRVMMPRLQKAMARRQQAAAAN